MKKKVAAAAVALSLFAATSAGVYAGANMTQIKAYLNAGLKFKVDGKPVQLRDGNGNTLVPITYNNTTYLPVRSVADVLNVAVDFDQKSGTIQFGEKSEGVSIAEGFDSMYHTKDSSKTTYNGKDYKDVYFDNATSSRGSSFMLYPKKKYNKLYLQVAAVGKDIEKISIKDTDTDTELKQTAVAMNDGLVTIEVDIGGVGSIFFHADVAADGALFIPLTTSYYK
ncbi:stalk domain-containing protein [Paenibacillus nasutitermitis]|uniref:Copper amine oxidase-like N-terminal domain-containing protein n=1 Tax=Paenibacillus nasutitermitis TaxID=1652958 RepID=A0A916Z9R0_9BACL|nr:stalk domain-containing protein [Paenibacillus nasutitermitis]GGD83199.1 hypothetical protein GCM10010911_46770 [Paenibacillus nasutitermitis]